MLVRTCSASFLAAALGLAATAGAQSYVYDARSMVLNGTWNRSEDNFIGGWATYGSFRDSQVADDFVLTQTTRLTKVTVDLSQSSSGAAPAGGFLIEVFANIAPNKPDETPTFAYTTAAYTLDGEFGHSTAAPTGVPPLGGSRTTWSVDVAGGNIVLAPGTWWISIVPVDETPNGSQFRAVGNNVINVGARTHRRSGGVDHGNNYPAALGAAVPNWSANTSSRPYTLSMRIEGAAENGSCCAGDNTCVQTSEVECMSGTWLAGAVCEPNPCPVTALNGACCAYSGACVITSQTNCIGATWNSGGTCIPAICPQPPIGVCCGFEGTCAALIQSACVGGPGGAMWTMGGVCDPNPCPLPPNFEHEPNDARAQANAITLADGDTFSGIQYTYIEGEPITVSTSRDVWRVHTAARPLGIYEHSLVKVIGNRSAMLVGLVQSEGVISSEEQLLLGGGGDSNDILRWYGFGKQEGVHIAIVSQGSPSQDGVYSFRIQSAPVAPLQPPGTVSSGAVTITVDSDNPGAPTDIWLYDGNLTAIPGAGNNYSTLTAGEPSVLTRTLSPGVYYLAVASYDLFNNLASPADDLYRSGYVLDLPDAVASFPPNGLFSLVITDTDAGTADVLYEWGSDLLFPTVWVKFTVTGAASEHCCRGTTCAAIPSGSCTGMVAGSSSLVVSSCGGGSVFASCCYADYNHDGAQSIDDLFLFLNAYFTSSPWADFGGDGTSQPTIDDLFLFINAYFGTCS